MTIDPNDLRFLREMTRDVIDYSRVRPNQRVGNSPRNTLGHTLIRPGGRDCYPAMWVRDFSMSLDSNLIPPDEIKQHLHLIATRQNGPAARKLKSGATIPPFAIPDHINFDGGPVFYPGTMSADEDQGGEPFGVLPPSDDHYEFIHIAYALWRATEDTTFLNDVINGLPLRERLVRAFELPRTSDATGGMAFTTDKDRAVGFGFHDAVYLTGSLLFPSLLRYRAARELARLAIHPPATGIALTIASHFAKVFADRT